MGTSNMWYWQEGRQGPALAGNAVGLELEEGKDFPDDSPVEVGIRRGKVLQGEWFWESGFDQHPIHDLEKIRDWNLPRPSTGPSPRSTLSPRTPPPSCSGSARRRGPASRGGSKGRRPDPRRHRSVAGRSPMAACRRPGTSTCTIQAAVHRRRCPDNPFISRTEFGSGVDRKNGFPVPYRCFYSKNIPNLFMAGRCISVTHEALETRPRQCGPAA